MIALLEILDFLTNILRAIRWLFSKPYRNAIALNSTEKAEVYWGLLLLTIILIITLAITLKT